MLPGAQSQTRTSINQEPQVRQFKFKDLFEIHVVPDQNYVVVKEKSILRELEELHPYISHEVKQVDRDLVVVELTDSDQGLTFFIMPWDTVVYSFYTPAGYACSYRISTERLGDAVVIEESGDAAGVNAYPGLTDHRLCR